MEYEPISIQRLIQGASINYSVYVNESSKSSNYVDIMVIIPSTLRALHIWEDRWNTIIKNGGFRSRNLLTEQLIKAPKEGLVTLRNTQTITIPGVRTYTFSP